MKRLIISLLLILICITSYSKHVTVTLTRAGTLEEAVSLSGIWFSDITSLKVNGPIDSDDIVFIRYLAGTASIMRHQGTLPKSWGAIPTPTTNGKLQIIDLSDANIVNSDNYYYYYNYEEPYNSYYYGTSYYVVGKTKKDTIHPLMFNNCNSLNKIIWPFCVCELNKTERTGTDPVITQGGDGLPSSVKTMVFGPNTTFSGSFSTKNCDVYYTNSGPNVSGCTMHYPNTNGILIQNFPDWASDNHDDNTTSTRTTKVHIPAGGTLSFDYSVSSEEDCDYLTVTINGKKLINKSGEASGKYTGTFDNEVIGDLTIKYSKDEMSAGGSDLGTIKNMTLTLPTNGYFEDKYIMINCDNFTYFDNEHFDMVVDFVAPKLTYKRTFNNTGWQALYVPFSIDYNEWKDEFDIARINNIHQYDDTDNGNIDRTELEIVKIKSGKTLPNTPYVIRAKSIGEKKIVVSNARISSYEDGGSILYSYNTVYNISGRYTPVSGETMVENGYYALGNGSLHQASSTSNNLQSNRWYMSVTDRDGNPKEDINEVKIRVLDGDWEEDETGVASIESTVDDNDAAVFDMSGRKVNEKDLRKGIYVKNGRKFMVK